MALNVYSKDIGRGFFYDSIHSVIQEGRRFFSSIDMDEAARLLIYARFQMENLAWIGFARELK